MKRKLLFLGGAYKNSGDFLIENRTKLHVDSLNSDLADVVFMRHHDINTISDIRGFDEIVFYGGPLFRPDRIQQISPITSSLSKANIDYSFLAISARFRLNKLPSVSYLREIAQLMNKKFKEGVDIFNKAKNIYTRDFLSADLLGLLNCKAQCIGDPGLFNPIDSNRSSSQPQENKFNFHKYLAFTPPANPITKKEGAKLYKLLARYYPCISTVVHDSTNTYTPIEANNIIHIEHKWDSSIYDQARAHVGFRLHAHLYCLSNNIPSFCIAEDNRAVGMKLSGVPNIFTLQELAHIKSMPRLHPKLPLAGHYNYLNSKYNINNFICAQMFQDPFDLAPLFQKAILNLLIG